MLMYRYERKSVARSEFQTKNYQERPIFSYVEADFFTLFQPTFSEMLLEIYWKFTI